MTRDEWVEILAALTAAYPTSVPLDGRQAGAWYEVLGRREAGDVADGCREWAATRDWAPPSAAAIAHVIDDLAVRRSRARRPDSAVGRAPIMSRERVSAGIALLFDIASRRVIPPISRDDPAWDRWVYDAIARQETGHSREPGEDDDDETRV